MSQNIVSAIFDDRAEAERAVAELRSADIQESAISIIGRPDDHRAGSDDDTARSDSREGHDKVNVATGVAAGGVAGAVLGVAALAIPGVGPLAAAGAIAASAVPTAAGVGAALGATGGALAKMFSDHDVGAEDASYYDERIHRGGVFVSVDTRQTDVRAENVGEILDRCGGHSASRPKATAV